jgi:protein-L-isoaspartate(D-aspartate) O-methyltransferase
MLTPQVTGRLLQALAVRGTDRVLEIGAGSGFVSACLARLGASVLSLEISPVLAELSRRNLQPIASWNVEVRLADAFEFEPDGSFDVIALTGSTPVPEPRFRRWLAEGGRLFVIEGEDPLMHARLVSRSQAGDLAGEWTVETLFETAVPPLTNASPAPGFVF